MNAILTVRYGLKRANKACYNLIITKNIVKKIGTMQSYEESKVNEEDNLELDVGDENYHLNAFLISVICIIFIFVFNTVVFNNFI